MILRAPVRSDTLWSYVGHQVYTARLAADLTPTALALHAHITKQMLHLIEQGKRGVRLEVLYRIAKATGQPIAYFLPPTADI